MGDLRKKRKVFVVIVSLVLFLIAVVSMVYYYRHTIRFDGNLSKYNPVSWAYQIDSAEINGNNLEINGWCFAPGDDADSGALSDLRIVAVDTDNPNNYHSFEPEYGIPRMDVNDYYVDEFDYTKCGFEVVLDLNSFAQNNTTYEIGIQPNAKKSKTIRPGIFFRDGFIYNYNPDTTKPLDVDGTDLQRIVEEGQLRVALPELGIYLYQDQWCLYYIADSNYPAEDGWDSIGCNVGTNDTKLLPTDRQEKGFDTIGFNFYHNEITDIIDSGKYRVAVLELPIEYPITYIATGAWTSADGWKWSIIFCPGLQK